MLEVTWVFLRYDYQMKQNLCKKNKKQHKTHKEISQTLYEKKKDLQKQICVKQKKTRNT